MTMEPGDPFATDVNIPDMKTSEDFAPFDVPGFQTIVTPPDKSQWPRALAVTVGVLLVAMLALGAWFFLSRGTIESPEPTVRAYYDALEAKDSARMASLMDPDVVSLAENALPLVDKLHEWIQSQTDLGVELGWDFQDLAFEVQNLAANSATVQVTGRVRVYEKVTSLGVALPYTWSHTLVKKNDRWYLEP